jgi:hypothetical protein
LLKHPDVLLAAAVSKPDAYAGELPVAYVQLVSGARTSANDLGDFAQRHIPERAAAPKEIIILEAMPLTDVQKPAKAELRRDAARRAFRDVLANVAGGKLSVDIVGSGQGQRGADHGGRPGGGTARHRGPHPRMHEGVRVRLCRAMDGLRSVLSGCAGAVTRGLDPAIPKPPNCRKTQGTTRWRMRRCRFVSSWVLQCSRAR